MTRFPVVRFKVWNLTFSSSVVAGDMVTGQVTSDSLR
jgi:hypothetical protein